MQKRLTPTEANQTLLLRSVSWIGSLGFLSAGLVGAQTATAPEGAKTPLAPAEAKPNLEGVPLEAGFESAPAPEKIAPIEVAPEESQEPLTESAWQEPVPTQEAVEIPQPETSAEPESQPSAIEIPLEPAEDYSHSYIDETEYNLGATTPYDNPPAVVLQERSTGCEAVISGGSVPGSVCAAAESAPTNPPIPGTPQYTETPQNILLPGNTAVTPNDGLPNDGLPNDGLPNVGLPNDGLPNVGLPNDGLPDETPAYPVAVEESTDSYPTSESTYADYPLAEVAYPVSEFPAMNLGLFQLGANGLVLDTRKSNSSSVYNRFYNPEAIALRNSSIRLTSLPGNGNTSIIFPLSIPAPITSAFGWRIHPALGSSRFHSGTDLGAPTGTPVVAALAGQVSVANFLGGYGLAVVLQHEKATKETLYGHLSEILVKQGEEVKQGEVIGLVGSTGLSTGPHLHFEIRKLTAEGWANLDPGGQLEYALAQMVNNFQTTQANASLKRLKREVPEAKSAESVESETSESAIDEESVESVESETSESAIDEESVESVESETSESAIDEVSTLEEEDRPN
jgi:murein DD-endopeptidase MepM/ murein hydrolase activator NlpD